MHERSAATRLAVVLACEASAYALISGALAALADLSVAASAGLWITLFFASRLALVLASFAFAWWASRPWNLSPRTWTCMIIGELVALLRFEWLILTEPLRFESRALRETDPTLPLVVFVHGIYCNRGIWRPLMKQLRHAGCEVRAVSVTPCMGDLAAQVRTLARWFSLNINPRSTRRIIVVAHSLGGLIVRGCMADTRIDTLICIGTPHAGSVVARALSSPIARDLRLNSVALAPLAAAGTDASRIVCLCSRHDNLVVPSQSAVLAGARVVEVGGIGHLALIYAPIVLDLIRNTLSRDGTGA